MVCCAVVDEVLSVRLDKHDDARIHALGEKKKALKGEERKENHL